MDSIKCIFCKKEMKPIYKTSDDQPENFNWDGGVVDKLYVGYGSKFDGEQIVISICDDCLESKIANKIILMK